MSQKNFRREDMKVSVAKDSKSKDAPAEQPPAEQSQQQQKQAPSQPQQEGQSSEEKAAEEESTDEEDSSSSPEPILVPAGTTAEILAWVGGDKARAQAALDKEQEKDRPRTGLVGELNQVLSR